MSGWSESPVAINTRHLAALRGWKETGGDRVSILRSAISIKEAVPNSSWRRFESSVVLLECQARKEARDPSVWLMESNVNRSTAIFLSLSRKTRRDTRLVSRRRDSSRRGRSISSNRFVVGSSLLSGGRTDRNEKRGKKEEKRCVRGFLAWNSYSGDSETSLSGAETTGPRTSRGPDSTLLLSFSPARVRLSFFSVSLSNALRCHEHVSPDLFVFLKIHPSCVSRLWRISSLAFSNWIDWLVYRDGCLLHTRT